MMSPDDSDGFSEDIDNEFFQSICDEGSKDADNLQFENLTPEQLIEHMLEIVNDVHQVTTLPNTVIRLLLDHFSWNKDALIEQYYEQTNPVDFVKSTILPAMVENRDELPSMTLKTYADVHGDTPDEMDCDICCCPSPARDMLGLGCEHYFCRGCWLSYLKCQILYESQASRLTCPGYQCEGLIDDDSVANILLNTATTAAVPPQSPGTTAAAAGDGTPQLPLAYRRFQRLMVNSFVLHNRYLTWCPGVDCGHAVRVSGPYGGSVAVAMAATPAGNRIVREVICANCEETFCFACGNPWHEPVLCKYLQLWINKIKNDAGTAHWVAANTKDCPQCKATIEKNGGCNHMTCRNANCKYEFCWVCLGSWELHGSQWYVCNSYKKAAAQKAREALDASRASLSRYLFYYDRYANHEQSRRLEATLKDSVANRMVELEQQGMSWIDVKFVRHVVEVLCACRRTLMYTYVFAYFLESSNEAMLFETNQRDLERATEDLSRLLEWDLNSKSLSGSLKQRLQDTSRYCEQRRRVLLEHVAEGYEKNVWRHRDNL